MSVDRNTTTNLNDPTIAAAGKQNLMDTMNDPWGKGGYQNIFGAQAGQIAGQGAADQMTLGHAASGWDTTPGFMGSADAVRQGAYGGALQNAYATARTSANALGMQAASLLPTYAGTKTTDSQSGLGTWLPQVAGAGLGALGSYFSRTGSGGSTSTPGGVVPPAGTTNTTGPGGTTTSSTPNSLLDPSISNFLTNYLGVSPNNGGVGGANGALTNINNSMLGNLAAGSPAFFGSSPFSSSMFGTGADASSQAALANSLLKNFFGLALGSTPGSGATGSPVNIYNNNTANGGAGGNATANSNATATATANGNGQGTTSTSTNGTGAGPTPNPPTYNSTWDPLPIPQPPSGTPPAFGLFPGDMGGVPQAPGLNLSFPAFDPGGTTNPQALQQTFGGGNNWTWDASQNRYDNGAGIFVDQNQQLYKEGPGGAKINLQYDPQYHIYTDGKGGYYDSSDGHPLGAAEVSMIIEGGNGWQGNLPGGSSTVPDDGTGGTGGTGGSNGTPNVTSTVTYDGNPLINSQGIYAQWANQPTEANYPQGSNVPFLPQPGGGPGTINPNFDPTQLTKSTDPRDQDLLRRWQEAMNGLGGGGNQAGTPTNPLLGGGGTPNPYQQGTPAWQAWNAAQTNLAQQGVQTGQGYQGNVGAGQGVAVNTTNLGANALLGATTTGSPYTAGGQGNIPGDFIANDPRNTTPNPATQGTGLNTGTIFNPNIQWQPITLANGQQAVLNPANGQLYDKSGAPLSNLNQYQSTPGNPTAMSYNPGGYTPQALGGYQYITSNPFTE